MIETYKRDAKFSSLSPYCIYAGEHDYIEMTDWKNCEGVDVEVNGKERVEHFSLTHGQMKALMALYNYEAE